MPHCSSPSFRQYRRMGITTNAKAGPAASSHQVAFGAQRPGSIGAPKVNGHAVRSLQVRPIPSRIARSIVERWHYLRTMPGGTQLAFGVFGGLRLLGAATLGVGPKNAHRLVASAVPDDCLTLTRLWLADELPRNSESHVLGHVLRALRRHTAVRFVLSYADPARGHVGVIYQASNWLYTGLSEAMPLLDLGDGIARHSRSLAHSYGTHSRQHFASHGIDVRLIEQAPKHRYLYPLDPKVRDQLTVPVLPYPKKEMPDGGR